MHEPLVPLAAARSAMPPPTSHLEEVVVVDPALLKWVDTVYPGAKIVTVFGDPKLPGEVYAIRLKLPANFVVQPHFHSQDEYMTVIDGSLHVGIGDTVDKEKTVFLPQGGAVGIPGGTPHYAFTTEEMIMQIHAIGPRDTIFCNHQ
jgi:mannose-6-phosphate isomerase-like protein (cupin superfamily)